MQKRKSIKAVNDWKEKNPENKKVKAEMKLTISDLNLEHIVKVDLGG